ncbi:MAG: glycyl-radical enzyme activating protein [Clostridia bacterium]|nr:glycyl-radical enzyme activating protein [Clostridia bacterium]
MNGRILNIQRFCTEDGPGIRTTVFMKGCPLRCIWCHNPESQKVCAEISFNKSKCVECGKCAAVCENGCRANKKHALYQRKLCAGCGKCAEICESGALEKHGEIRSADEICRVILKDRVYYEASGGGVTLSGGEPLYQWELAEEILRRCSDEGIHTAIETCGYGSEKVFRQVIKHCDLVLFDIKETDAALHKRYTGVDLKPILRNLSILNSEEIPFFIRAPIIPSLNDRIEHFTALRKLRESMKSCLGIQVMPYHNIGRHKYDLLGRDYACEDIPEPDAALTEYWKSLI